MKKITRKEFLEIKKPVLFSRDNELSLCYTYFPEWATNDNDFYFVILKWDEDEVWKEIWESWQRDWVFDEEEMFYVYDNDDIHNLIDILKELL